MTIDDNVGLVKELRNNTLQKIIEKYGKGLGHLNTMYLSIWDAKEILYEEAKKIATREINIKLDAELKKWQVKKMTIKLGFWKKKKRDNITLSRKELYTIDKKFRKKAIASVKKYQKTKKGKITTEKASKKFHKKNPNYIRDYMRKRRIYAIQNNLCSKCL